MDSDQNVEPILNQAITRRDATKVGGMATVGLAFTKAIIEAGYAKSAFADYILQEPPEPCAAIDGLDYRSYGVTMPLPVGAIITDQFPKWGIHVKTRAKVYSYTRTPNRLPMIFDTSNPSGDDFDLGTPDEQYPGGVGVSDDDFNDPVQDQGTSNSIPSGNVLIISADRNSKVPKDNGPRGLILFKFDPPVAIS